jgi:hypothetical protein
VEKNERVWYKPMNAIGSNEHLTDAGPDRSSKTRIKYKKRAEKLR